MRLSRLSHWVFRKRMLGCQRSRNSVVADQAFGDEKHNCAIKMNSRNMNPISDSTEALGDVLSFLGSIAEKYELSEIEMLGILEYSKKQITSAEDDWISRN